MEEQSLFDVDFAVVENTRDEPVTDTELMPEKKMKRTSTRLKKRTATSTPKNTTPPSSTLGQAHLITQPTLTEMFEMETRTNDMLSVGLLASDEGNEDAQMRTADKTGNKQARQTERDEAEDDTNDKVDDEEGDEEESEANVEQEQEGEDNDDEDKDKALQDPEHILIDIGERPSFDVIEKWTSSFGQSATNARLFCIDQERNTTTAWFSVYRASLKIYPNVGPDYISFTAMQTGLQEWLVRTALSSKVRRFFPGILEPVLHSFVCCTTCQDPVIPSADGWYQN
jgi:hypothetical protein